MPRVLSLLYPNGDAEYWVTDEVFGIGDKITRDGQTWIVTTVGNYNRDGKALAVALHPEDEKRP